MFEIAHAFRVSIGSTCASGAVERRHVLLALGMLKQSAKSNVRFSLGAENTSEQVDKLIDALVGATTQLWRLSPVYATHV